MATFFLCVHEERLPQNMSVFFHIKAHCDVEHDKYSVRVCRCGLRGNLSDGIHTGKTNMGIDCFLKSIIPEVLLFSVGVCVCVCTCFVINCYFN